MQHVLTSSSATTAHNKKSYYIYCHYYYSYYRYQYYYSNCHFFKCYIL